MSGASDEFHMELASMDPTVPPQLASLLSACSYSVPSPDSPSHPGDPAAPRPAHNAKNTQQAEVAAVSLGPAESSPAAASSTPRQAPRKRGRPRKTPDDQAHLTPKERRRLQVLSAQRAYQSRKEVTVSNQRDRIAKLEATILRMNSLVGSLGAQLAQADTLALHPHLESTLRSTVASCASLAKEVDQSKLEGELPSSQPRAQHEKPSPMQGGGSILPSPTSPILGSPELPNPSGYLWNVIHSQRCPPRVNSPRPPLTTTSAVELSTFISKLRLACAYNAFQTLSDPTVLLDTVRNKFRFLLSLMSREHLTSYYKASLQARLDPSALNPWDAVPFFGLGGAGSHYSRSSSSGKSSTGDAMQQNDWPLVSDPLLDFTAEIRESLDDTWFDARDLEGYLKEKEACLVVFSPSMDQHENPPKCIDVVRLLQVLTSRCICLGRSPGWRRSDVEEAVRKAASP